jgi:DNA repair exonuclease SbcCD ATPase subunit
MITFEKVRFKNFLSTGNYFTEIQLNRSNNTLVVGTNGAGKSTMLDAICFALFGKPFRFINKPGLVNSINARDCVVEIEFSIGDRAYKVIRGIKPNVFEIYCNGQMVNQDAKVGDYQEQLEKLILKLNYKTFTQVVILGSASFTPFMQLSPKDRRIIIEDLLDIEIFSSMNLLVKQKLNEQKDSLFTIKNSMELLAEKISLQKENIEVYKKNNDEEVAKKKQEIWSNTKLVSKYENDIAGINKHIASLQSMVQDESANQEKSKKYVQLETKLESKIKKLQKEIEFYHENDSCPTCTQDINPEFKHLKKIELATEQNKMETGLEELNLQIQKVNDRINEIYSINKSITEHNTEVAKLNVTISALINHNTKLATEISSITEKSGLLEEDNTHLQDLKKQLNSQIEQHKELIENKHYYEFASNLLKDGGVKTRIIKQYLPVMNKLINKYLSSMNFFVNFNIDENFEETIKSRYRDDFSYYNFSEGEKFRIDVALLLTWRQIARLKNSVNTNLLILDEVFDSSLDTGGTDEFMKLIYDLGQDTNVFVISHKGDQLFDKFRSVIRFQKRNNFSEMVK